MGKITHKERVLKYMEDFGSITQLECAKDLGNYRLSASIWLLIHKDNVEIDSITEYGTNRYGEKTHYSRYYLKGSKFDKEINKKKNIFSKLFNK